MVIKRAETRANAPPSRPVLLCIIALFSLGVTYFLVTSGNKFISRLTSSSDVSPVETRIRSLISSYPVVVFSKSYCPYSKRAKHLLKELGARAKVIELDIDGEGKEIQAKLADITGQKTVPNVWIGSKFVGGSDDLFKLEDKGSLLDKLKAAEAIV